MRNEDYLIASKKCLDWVNDFMLTFEKGKWGVFERMVISNKERVDQCRPDTASETLLAMTKYMYITKTDIFSEQVENLTKWLEYAQLDYYQKSKGAFPFALPNGMKRPIKKAWQIFLNDEGKVLINLFDLFTLTNDDRYLAMAKKLADFLVSIQDSTGRFYIDKLPGLVKDYGPCFVLWVMVGLLLAEKIFNEQQYGIAANKAHLNFLSMIEKGRVKTSWEISKSEQWRPESSENFIALYALSRAFLITRETKYINTLEQIWKFCKALIDTKTGAIKNGIPMEGSVVEKDSTMCDLVYTQGYALKALNTMYCALHNKEILDAAINLADWLVSIQCGQDDEYFIRGGWRGSYSLEKNCYAGSCDNWAIEGGADMVYVGWASVVNAYELMRSYELINDIER